MCGEHIEIIPDDEMRTGSSPRVRGTLRNLRLQAVDSGIIPACAGNTDVTNSGAGSEGDHPRVCGEHPAREGAGLTMVGSSPRVRGTLYVVDSVIEPLGIIPACAGNTPPASPAFPCRRDHPRVCGEHGCNVYSMRQTVGSSPRVRGTLSNAIHHNVIYGIIPACAGNTLKLSNVTERFRDHPRVCGEHYLKDDQSVGYQGSSPRVRGTLLKIPVQNTIATELRLLFNEFAK